MTTAKERKLSALRERAKAAGLEILPNGPKISVVAGTGRFPVGSRVRESQRDNRPFSLGYRTEGGWVSLGLFANLDGVEAELRN
jgi:hypothetical protein